MSAQGEGVSTWGGVCPGLPRGCLLGVSTSGPGGVYLWSRGCRPLVPVSQMLQMVCSVESDTPSSKKVVQFKDTSQYSDFCKYWRVAGSYPL